MQIPLRKIGPERLSVEWAHDTAGDERLASLAKMENICFPGPVQVAATLEKAGKFIEARGKLTARIQIDCSRCLASFSMLIATQIEWVFAPEKRKNPEALTGVEQELNSEDAGLFYFEGDTLDLGPAVHEEVLAGLPLKPLCNTDCKGLCAQCGANLNHTTCSCEDKAVDPRLAVLQQLKLD